MRTLQERTGIVFVHRKDFTYDVSTPVAGNMALYQFDTEALLPGSYLIRLYGMLKSSGGHTVYLSFHINDIQIFRCPTNATTPAAVYAESEYHYNSSPAKARMLIKLYGTGGSSATIPAYNIYGVTMEKIR